VKLVLREPESGALRSWLDSVEENRSTIELAHVEVLRACRRITEKSVPRARLVLDALDLIPTTAGLLESAARADPAQLRSLDAIHLAAAASLLGDAAESGLFRQAPSARTAEPWGRPFDVFG
jgi:predicted nucleic acid-binding protein